MLPGDLLVVRPVQPEGWCPIAGDWACHRDDHIHSILTAGGREPVMVQSVGIPRGRAVFERVGTGPELADRLPGYDMIEIDGVGHAPQMQALDRFLAALSGFLGPGKEG